MTVRTAVVPVAEIFALRREVLRPAYRIRGMASADAVRGRGYGAAVLRAGAGEARTRGATLLWCTGRTDARGFYQRYGFQVSGDEFVIEGVGPHLLLVRGAADAGGAPAVGGGP